MRALAKDLLEARVKTFNPEHSFVVSGVSPRRLFHYVSQIPGVALTTSRDGFTFRDLTFTVDDGGDTGGDGLWIMTKDGLPHPEEVSAIRNEVERMIDEHRPSKSREYMTWVVLGGAFLLCAVICFATLQTLTPLSIWAAGAISIPGGAGLFYVACKWAEM